MHLTDCILSMPGILSNSISLPSKTKVQFSDPLNRVELDQYHPLNPLSNALFGIALPQYSIDK